MTTSPNATASRGVPTRPPISAASAVELLRVAREADEDLVAGLGEEARGVAADPSRPDDTDTHRKTIPYGEVKKL